MTLDEIREAAWKGRPEVVRFARIRTNTELLSTLIGSMKDTKNPILRLKWGIEAELKAQRLFVQLDRLTTNQLDVLGTWLVKTARLVPFRSRQAVEITKLAWQKACRAHSRGKIIPHQLGLACVLHARALTLKPLPEYSTDLETTRSVLAQALALEPQVRGESDQPQGLRQLVRIKKSTAEVLSTLGEKDRARNLLVDALALAEGSADTKSQADHIRRLLKDPRLK